MDVSGVRRRRFGWGVRGHARASASCKHLSSHKSIAEISPECIDARLRCNGFLRHEHSVGACACGVRRSSIRRTAERARSPPRSAGQHNVASRPNTRRGIRLRPCVRGGISVFGWQQQLMRPRRDAWGSSASGGKPREPLYDLQMAVVEQAFSRLDPQHQKDACKGAETIATMA